MDSPRDAFLKAAVWHGGLDSAAELLAAHPEIASSEIYTAAVLGDDVAVQRFLDADASLATAKGGAHGWDALTYLCFSKYLRLDRDRTPAFVRAATALLDAGASANSGFFEDNHQPKPEWESVLYGAAGVAQNPEVTRLLLERGGDPNDGEVPYHVAETWDNGTLSVLIASGKLNATSLNTILLRKSDWHDADGAKMVLDAGADPNSITVWKYTALHQAVRRDNGLKHVELLLDYGADPAIRNGVDGRSAMTIAARRGRADVLEAIERRGIAMVFEGVDRLIAACARGDRGAVEEIAKQDPALVQQLLAEGGTLLADFACTGNAQGIGLLLDLGVPVTARSHGDGYFGIAFNSTALHVAAWRAWHGAVRVLIERGAPVGAVDGKGRTPLMLAVKACVDSYWMVRRKPDSVCMLLDAGASIEGVAYPSGYDEVDELLRASRLKSEG